MQQGTTSKRLTTNPFFTYNDASGVPRQCFIEEILQSFTGVESIDIITAGSGYTSTPTVTIEGDGVGATARALIVNGSLKRVEVVNSGTGYTSAVVKIVGGGGAGATVKANLQGRRGKLRIVYFDENQIKKTLNDDIGTIDYQNGIVSLNNFAPTAIDDPFGTLVFTVVPLTKIFTSVRNRILTLDVSDPSSIRTSINAVVE